MAKNKKKAKAQQAETPAPTGTPAGAPTTAGRAKVAAAKAAKQAAEVVSKAAEVVEDKVVRLVVEAVGVKKAKRARYVRPAKEPKPAPAPVVLPPRSTSAAGKLMTRGLAAPPPHEGGRPRGGVS